MALSGVIHVRATRAQVLRELRRLPALVRGGPSGAGGAVAALQVRLGLSILGDVKTAFVQKAAGGTDEAGDRWTPLSPKTIAYSRRHPGLPPGKKRAERAPSYALTQAQRRRWWALYQSFGGTRSKGRPYHARGSRSMAAARAWKILKSEGATTLLDLYGSTRVQILRDKGLLLNSLSPGVQVGDQTPPVPPPKPPFQVFRLTAGVVILGTNRKWAITHHRGVPGRIPQRRLWPQPSRWPQRWWTGALRQAIMGVNDVIRYLLRAT